MNTNDNDGEKQQVDRGADQAASSENNESFHLEIINKISSLESKNAELQDGIMRAVAETENVRRIYERKVEEARLYSVSSFAKDLLEVLDNFDRAIIYASDSADPTIQGVKMTKHTLDSVLKKHGVGIVPAEVGQQADYALHQAVSTIETDQFPDGAIVEIAQTGYSINGRLLRPAIVKVAKRD